MKVAVRTSSEEDALVLGEALGVDDGCIDETRTGEPPLLAGHKLSVLSPPLLMQNTPSNEDKRMYRPLGVNADCSSGSCGCNHEALLMQILEEQRRAAQEQRRLSDGVDALAMGVSGVPSAIAQGEILELLRQIAEQLRNTSVGSQNT